MRHILQLGLKSHFLISIYFKYFLGFQHLINFYLSSHIKNEYSLCISVCLSVLFARNTSARGRRNSVKFYIVTFLLKPKAPGSLSSPEFRHSMSRRSRHTGKWQWVTFCLIRDPYFKTTYTRVEKPKGKFLHEILILCFRAS